MPNIYDQRKLIEKLIHDKERELMPHEINDILEKELSKPADEVDMQLIDELLELLGTETPAEADKEACWQSIQKKRKKQKRFNWKNIVRRASAVAAAVVVVFFVAFESAKAFRWNTLLKLLAPVAETFGIYSTSTFDSEDSVNKNTLVIDDTEYEQVTYAAIEQMPSEVGGYRIIPAWIPERFDFVQGNVYEDPDMAYCSLTYVHLDSYLGLNAYIYHNEEAVAGFEYERTLSEPQSEEVNGLLVNYYRNQETGELSSASWIYGNVHYNVEGDITDEELRRIVVSMIE